MSTSIVVAGAARPDRADHRSEVRSPAVVEIVAVDRGHDHMLEAELSPSPRQRVLARPHRAVLAARS